MATVVQLFCSSDDVDETQEFLLSEATESAKKSPQVLKAGRGRKLTRARGGKSRRTGRNVRTKSTSNATCTSSSTSGEVMSESENDTQQGATSPPDNDEQVEEDNHTPETKVPQARRSCRTKVPSKYFISELQSLPRKRLAAVTHTPRRPGQPDVNQDGTPFCCDDCGSNHIVKQSQCLTSKGNAAVPKRKRVFRVRYKIDPKTKKQLTLCNACGIKFDRSEKSQDRYKVSKVTEQDKQKYLEDAKRFASSLVEGLKDPDAHRLACLHISSKPCGCMQRYIIAEGNMEESRDRASKLLKMIKDAKKLKDKKSYNVEELLNKGKKFRKVGIGNGQKRSKEFEEFVLTNRQYLRNSLKFCERACQRILSYSNNFLHKRLKTEPDRRERVERTKGKMALGLLKDIADLPGITCCEAECVMLAGSHAVLLKTWRERANSGQAEARKVLAEMLTPSGKVSNCANFITLVTGCSLRTIQSVADQMRETGGDREPPTHGLKKYWKNNPRRQRSLMEFEQDLLQSTRDTQQPAAPMPGPEGATSGSGGDGSGGAEIETPSLTAAQLRDKQNQLKRLQQQLDEQQRKICQQQSVVEQQLQQHKLAVQQKRLQQKQRQHHQEKQQQQQQQQQQQLQQQQQQQLTETQQRDMIQVQQQTPSEVATQPASRQQVDVQQASTQQQQMSQLAAQQQLLLQQLGAQQIAQQLAAQQQQVASTGTAVAVAPPTPGLEGMMDSRLLQQNMQQLLQDIQNQINVQQNSMHQLLLEMQSEMTAQQLQQLGIPNASSTSVSSGVAVQTVTAALAASATASQPPPSYNAAVTLLNALNSGHMLNASTQLLPQQPQQQQPQQQQQQPQQQQQQPQPQTGAVVRQGTTQPAQVIIQAIPAIQQNFLLGGATLHGPLLQGAGNPSRQTAQQQILVSLPSSLTTECMTSSALPSTPLSQDALNPDMVEIVELQQIPLANDASPPQGHGIQPVSLTSELDAAALARLSRALSAQELRPGMGAALPQLQSRTARAAGSSPPELADTLAREGAVQSVLQGGNSADGQTSSSSSLASDASQMNMNIESLLPAFQIPGPAGQSLAVYKQGSANVTKQ